MRILLKSSQLVVQQSRGFSMHNLFFAKDDTFLDQFSKFLQVREQSKSDLTESVRKIIAQVKIRGDQALIDYTKI